HLIDTLEVGGSEKSLLELVSRFSRWHSTVCHTYRGDRLRPLFEKADIPVLSLHIRGKYSFVAGRKRLLEIISAERPDVLHSTLFRSGIIARLIGRRRELPVIDSFVNESYAPA